MRNSNIRFLIMDVDGTLTDGKIYMGQNGEIMKVFNIKDGCGIYTILPRTSIIPIVITARESKILECRCRELKIAELHQSCHDKLGKLNTILKRYSLQDKKDYSYESCAYIGDDIIDLQCMEPIHAAGGIVGAPADAVMEVRSIADFVSVYNGGDGAVRDFIEWLLYQKFIITKD